ncbi:MAG: hypothetical protein G01um101431_1011 [Parcubacteria group bacterium Gr01-1014_31]|nr:MAG: hypothetical protein G01um101431_1011 [Parcubacteria group bacterium Gr01-1014_31]
MTKLSRPQRLTLSHLRHLPRLLNSRERRQVNALLILALISLAYLGYRWYGRNVVQIPLHRGSYTEALVGAPQYLNPLLLSTNDVDADIASLLFAGLFRYDRRLTPVPDLAESYTTSEDGTRYVVKLKPNLRWHDGNPVTADDVVFTFTSAQLPEFNSALRHSLSGVKVSTTGEREVTFQLPERHERFLDLLTTGLLPEHLWGEIPPIHATLNEYNLNNPIGAGAWRFKSLTKDRHGNIKSYTLVPFIDAAGSKPYLQEITFKFYADYTDAVAALNNRSVDGVGFLPVKEEGAITDPQVKRYPLALPQYTAIFFNPNEQPALKEKNIRLALAHAVDRAKILSEALNLRGEPAIGPLLPTAPGFDPDLKAPAYDQAAAAQLLDDAGWTRLESSAYRELLAATSTATTTPATAPSDTTTTAAAPETAKEATDPQPYYRRNKAGTILELALTTVDRPENVSVSELVANAWRAIGVKVVVNLVPPRLIAREVLKPRAYQALLYGEAIGADPDPYPFWHSSQAADPGLNLALFANRQADKLLEEARAASDSEGRALKYREFANLIAAETPAVFLYIPNATYALHGKIKGFTIKQILLPQDRFLNLPEWYVATGRRLR